MSGVFPQDGACLHAPDPQPVGCVLARTAP